MGGTVRAIDLYSGVGGWSLGLSLAGLNVVASYERWKAANLTNERNNGHTTHTVDIRALSLDELPCGIDVVVGSPPCTEFSLSNRGGAGDIKDGLKDIIKFLTIVDHLQPRFWVMENVPRAAEVIDRELGKRGRLARFRHLNLQTLIVNMEEFGLRRLFRQDSTACLHFSRSSRSLPSTKLPRSGTRKPKTPSDALMRAAVRFVFDTLDWKPLFHGSPPVIFVHGDGEFERLRAEMDLASNEDRARSAVVRAIVRLVQSTRAEAVAFSVGGLAKLEGDWEAARTRLKRRLRSAITQARRDGGYEAVEALNSFQEISKYDIGTRPRTDAAPTPDRCPDALFDEVSFDPKPLPGSALVLPHAGKEELRKAAKYVLGGPASVKVVRLSDAPLKLGVKGSNARAGMYLRGALTSSEPDRARCAVAFAAKHLIEEVNEGIFDTVAPSGLGTLHDRLSFLESKLTDAIRAAINRDGLVGLDIACRIGWVEPPPEPQ